MVWKTFGRNIIAFATSLCLVSCVDSNNLSSDLDRKVLIVGAGIAGVKAAVDLKEAGFDVEIIEARNRIGGRLWSESETFGVPLDFGGAWIHGIDSNPLYNLANEAKLSCFSTDNTKAYHTDGSDLDCPNSVEFYDLVWNFIDKIKADQKVSSVKDTVHPGSTWTYILKNGKKLLADYPEKYRKAIFKVCMEMQSYYATYWEENSYGGLAVDFEYEGSHVVMKEGYQSIVEHLISKANLSGSINLNHIVNRIKYDSEGVEIQVFDANSQTSKTFNGIAVIVTVPLGVLKEGAISFDPILPKEKLESIKNLGFGLYDKVIIEFGSSLATFWPREPVEVIQVVPTNDTDWNALNSKEAKWTPYRPRSIQDIGFDLVNMEDVVGKPILVMLFYSDAAKLVENISINKENLMEFAKARLIPIFGANLPAIQNITATQWGLDPYARGSFSNIPTTASGADMDRLAQPVLNRVFIAGEATYKLNYSTAHGAYYSGARDAEKIISLYS